jgi:hypothetical protein
MYIYIYAYICIDTTFHLFSGDNLIEIRKFLTHLMPSDNHNLNPFSPKEQEDFNIQCNLAKVLSSMSGTFSLFNIYS